MCGRTSERCPFCTTENSNKIYGHLEGGAFFDGNYGGKTNKFANKIMEDEICQERKQKKQK